MIFSPPERAFRQSFDLRLGLLIFPGIAWVVALLWWNDPDAALNSRRTAATLSLLWIAVWVVVGIAKLTIHPEGVRRRTIFGVTEIAWEEVSETRFVQVSAARALAAPFRLLESLMRPLGDLGPALLGPLNALIGDGDGERSGGNFAESLDRNLTGKGGDSGQKTLSVHCMDGRKLKITPNWRDSEDAMRTVLDRVNPRIGEELWPAVESGATVKFGDVSLSQRGIAWKDKEPIPVSKLAKCRIEGPKLRVKARDKSLGRFSVKTRKVPNIFVLLDLVDELRLGGWRPQIPDPLERARG